ncbi:MAG TPA: FAD-dependent oxidoreductase [Thermomicrobiales bacterium]|nr:FAD-dependent oxidoreductase [Thermomicrobiales bacterium]
MSNPDVIVVGGGVNGTSVAYRLAQAGKKVTLFEQRGICSGASGRNGGMTGEGARMHNDGARQLYAMTSANWRMLQELPQELGADFQLRKSGTIEIAQTKAQWDHMVERHGIERAAGAGPELLDMHETRKLMPAVTEDIYGSKYTRSSGHIWPFALVDSFANAAARLGAELRTHTPVAKILECGGRADGVELLDGSRVHAGEVVLATNSYTPLLLRQLPNGAIVPARGQILATEPVAPVLPLAWGNNFDKEYGRQVPGGPIICGGFRRLDEQEGLGLYEERVTLPVISGIGKRLTGLFPVLAGVKVVRAWAGIMGFTPDGLPLIGRTAIMDGLTIVAGFNGGGFSWGAINGKIVADELTGKSHGFDLSYFRPDRFEEKGTAWRNPYTAGEKNSTAVAV